MDRIKDKPGSAQGLHRVRKANRIPAILGFLLAAPALSLLTARATANPVHRPAFSALAEDSEELTATQKSKIVSVTLPSGALRSTSKSNIAQFAVALRKVAAKYKRRIGEVEVLAWAQSGDVKKALPRSLKELGYVYAEEAPIDLDGDKITLFASAHKESKRQILGMWTDRDGQLVLAWTSVTAEDSKETTPASGAKAGQSDGAAGKAAEDGPAGLPASSGGKAAGETDGQPIVVDAADTAHEVNVMGRAMPAIPSFPKVTPKPGVVRGYVRDTQNRPLKGALIGVRSTAVGGFYSGASAKSDANGYYEIAAPQGVAHFYCAGYRTEYGDLLAAYGLHPADGDLDTFATPGGLVKNWVLLPYGIADRAKAQEDPHYAGNYYGGTIYFGWYADDDERFSNPKNLPPSAQVEITLTPDGPLLDGSRGRPIVIRKRVGKGLALGLYVNNIPVGRYKIAARLDSGKALRMKETGPYGNQPFGLEPKEAVGEAALLLKVGGADPNSAIAGHGNWQAFQVSLERP